METQTAFFTRLNAKIDQVLVKVEGLRELTPEQWSWTPNKDTWSIATTLDHLNKTNGAIMPLYHKAVAELKTKNLQGTADIRFNRFERFAISIVSPNPPFKVPVPPVFMPKVSDVDGKEALQRFLTQHREIKRIMANAAGYDVMRVKIVSPASKYIHLRFGTELDALSSHDLYHWLQIEAKRNDPRFPK